MGGRMFRNWLCRPLCDLPAIELRQDAVAELKDSDNRLIEIRKLLGDIADPERIAARIATARAMPRDLVALARTLAAGAETAGNVRAIQRQTA